MMMSCAAWCATRPRMVTYYAPTRSLLYNSLGFAFFVCMFNGPPQGARETADAAAMSPQGLQVLERPSTSSRKRERPQVGLPDVPTEDKAKIPRAMSASRSVSRAAAVRFQGGSQGGSSKVLKLEITLAQLKEHAVTDYNVRRSIVDRSIS